MASGAASFSLSLAGWLSALAFAYLAAGVIFAALFFRFGLDRVDKATRGSSMFFRLLIVPATVALWPWLLGVWRRALRETP